MEDGQLYNVIVYDNLIGGIEGRTPKQEANYLNNQLKMKDARISKQFTYSRELDALVGELAVYGPWVFVDVLSQYDQVIFKENRAAFQELNILDN
jgi:hypothetical protein